MNKSRFIAILMITIFSINTVPMNAQNNWAMHQFNRCAAYFKKYFLEKKGTQVSALKMGHDLGIAVPALIAVGIIMGSKKLYSSVKDFSVFSELGTDPIIVYPSDLNHSTPTQFDTQENKKPEENLHPIQNETSLRLPAQTSWMD